LTLISNGGSRDALLMLQRVQILVLDNADSTCHFALLCSVASNDHPDFQSTPLGMQAEQLRVMGER
jgi:hypothetical protein